MRDRRVAAKALVFGSPKKMARKPSSQLRQKKFDCPVMKLIKEVASLVIEEELPSSDGTIASTSEGSVLSTTSDSVSTNSDSRSEASVVHDSCQGSEVEAGVNTTELDDNKENIPSLEENFERSAEVSVVHPVSQDPEIEADENASSLEEDCKKPNIIQKMWTATMVGKRPSLGRRLLSSVSHHPLHLVGFDDLPRSSVTASSSEGITCASGLSRTPCSALLHGTMRRSMSGQAIGWVFLVLGTRGSRVGEVIQEVIPRFSGLMVKLMNATMKEEDSFDVFSLLGLHECADTHIGDETRRGISGG